MAEDRLMKVHRFKMPLATRGYISIRSRRFQDYEVLASAARVHITKMGGLL